MPVTISNQRIRAQLDVSRWFQSAVDVITSTSPQLANDADLQFEFCFSYGALVDDTQLASMTNWASVKLTLKNINDRDGIGYWSQTLSNSDLNAALTFAGWTAGTAQHCVFTIPNAVNSLLFQGVSSQFWLVVEIDTNDTPAKIFPAIVFPVNVLETGVGTQAPVTVTPNSYYTKQDSDARYAMTVNLNAKANLAGATFTGAVVLAAGQMSGATGLFATTKAYVDAGDATVAAAAVPNTGTSTVAGLKSFSSLLTASAGLTVVGTTTLATSLSGVLKATAGVVSGAATTTDLTEGSNLYFTNARAIASTLTGYTATSGTVASTDTILQAIQKLGYTAAHLPTGLVVWPVASQASMLLLSSAVKGDHAYRSDTNTVFILGSGSPATLGSWSVLLYPVTTVNGLGGATSAVVLTTDNVAEGSSAFYYTNARADARITLQKNVASGLAPLDSGGLLPLANLPLLTGYAAGGSLPILTTDTILQAFQKLGNAATTSLALSTALTGYSAASGTISSATTVLGAFNILGALATGISKLQFSGTTNPGLIVNQLSTTQINALPATGGNYGNIVYDTTLNQVKVLINGSWVSIGSSTALPLTAGSGFPLTGTLYIGDSISATAAIQIGTNWSVRTSASDAKLDFRYNSTTVLSIDSGNVVHAPAGYYDTPNGYYLNTNPFLYLNSGANAINFGGNFSIYTAGSYARLSLVYNGTEALEVDTSANVSITSLLKMSANKVIDQNNYYYDSSGHQILAGQQAAIANASNAGADPVPASDYNTLVSKFNTLLSYLRNHGVIAT